MNPAIDLPLWAAIPAAFFLVVGATLTLIGSYGLARIKTFYERLHAPTLGTSWGVAGIALCSMIVSSVVNGRPIIHELLIAVFIMITTPVTLMLLGRAVLYRQQAERAEEQAARAALERAEEALDPDHGEAPKDPEERA